METVHGHGWPLVMVGTLLLVGFVASILGRRAHVPRVTLLLLLGVLAGPSGLALVPTELADWFPLVSEIALSLVGFKLGEEFLAKKLRSVGRQVLAVSITATVLPALVVLGVLLLVGAPLDLSLLLAGIAPASAPAATLDVIRESRVRGPVSDTVLAVVAIDDALGIILFTIMLAIAKTLSGDAGTLALASTALWEVGGGIGLGALMGVPMAWLTGRVREGKLTAVEATGFVLLCGGFAELIGVSYLLACISLGAMVANRAKHHTRPFHAIDGVTEPFLLVFFLLAGFEFDLKSLGGFGLIGVAYVVARIVGKVIGGAVGAQIAGADRTMRRHVGWCLLPQAGVALGLGLLAAQRFPELGGTLLSLLVGTTFVFEVAGPLATRVALSRAGEVGKAEDAQNDDSWDDSQSQD